MAAIPILVPIDFTKQELQNPRMQNLSTAPSSPVSGQFYYDTDDNHGYVWNGSSWESMAGGGIASTIVDAKGDLITATANDTPVRKAAGANGTFLQAQSGQADGLLWTALADGDIPASIFRDAEHTVASHQEIIATADLTDWPRVAALDVNSQKITSLGTPTTGTDAATKAYVDSAAVGIDWKASVRAATTAAGTLATSFENADVIDGVTLATGDRILIKDQAAGAENGIYVVAASGAPTRATDADTNAEVTSGLAVFVEEGTANADSGWVLTTNGTITVGTTSIAFTQFTGLGQVTSGAGLTKTGNTLDVGQGTGITVNANDVAVDTSVVTRKYAASFGDGAATSYNIDHNLGTLDVIVDVYRNSDGVTVLCDVTRSTTNRVVLAFSVAPTSNQYRAVVHG